MNPFVEEMNAILEGDSETLAHYGVKGMKWGVRRTPEQLGHHIKNVDMKTFMKDAKTILESLSSDDFSDFQEPKNVYSKKIYYEDGNPAAFGLSERRNKNGIKAIDLSVAVRREYRGKGIASSLAKDMIDEAVRDPEISKIYWGAEKSNASSISLAKKLNFKHSYDTDYYSIYELDAKPNQRVSEQTRYDTLAYEWTDEMKHFSNPVVEEMVGILAGDKDVLAHYGMPRRSGRYPWGSGDDPYQHGRDLLGRIEELRKKGWTESAESIRKEFGLSTNQYRLQKAIAKDERLLYSIARVKSLQKDGLNVSQIGKQMGVNESTVRSWLNPSVEANARVAKNTAKFLKQQIKEKGIIDVGKDVERELNISRNKLDEALEMLRSEGYPVYSGRMEQVTNRGNWTTLTVVCPKGTPYKDMYNFDEVHSLGDYITRDGGDTYEKKFTYPSSLDPKRLMVRYAEEGGLEKDGVIELRRGLDDLSLGESRYSQVRILVGGTHYLKGMAVYSDNMPDGVDVIFNTNKSKGTPALGPKDHTVLKQIKSDPENPFGSAIKDARQGGQYWYTDKNGEKKLGLINKRADEGDWTDWKDALPSQFLSKQSVQMAKKQLGLAITDKTAEFDDIRAINNPTIKKHFLQKFADECDSAAVNLQAAALPGQKYHVIIPVPSLKDTEVYAPKYENGTKLALVRYPHGGTFEIPILTVNNKNTEARSVLGTTPSDAIGITSRVAERLSGADFDGDTVMCIPTHDSEGKVKITSKPPLQGLVGFDHKALYGTEAREDGYYSHDGRKVQIMKNTGTQMGIISNLITDMTLKGASDEELAAAVRHSMVVIDAEKHKLDYKASEVDNNIAALKQKYQDGGGASTLISRAKGQATVSKRQGSPIIDPETGKQTYKLADDRFYDVTKVNARTGEVTTVTKERTQKSTKMAETDDARTLISTADTQMEHVYADYANHMKSMANQARKELMAAGRLQHDSAAKKEYAAEVDSLMAKLNEAEKNRPRERAAQLRANAEVRAKQEAYREQTGQRMKGEDLKKASQQALSKYRSEVGSVSRSDRSIKITDREWEAIQKGAITENVLKKILNNADIDELRQRATPRETTTLSQVKINRIKALSASNYSLSEIARKMGVSSSTVSKYLKGAK